MEVLPSNCAFLPHSLAVRFYVSIIARKRMETKDVVEKEEKSMYRMKKW